MEYSLQQNEKQVIIIPMSDQKTGLKSEKGSGGG